MSLQIAVFAPATRVMSRKLGPTWRSASPCVGQPRGGLRGEHVGQHVRQVAEHGHEPVVGLGVHRHRLRAHVHHEAVQALVQEAAGLLVRREVPDGALEQVGARVLHAGGLGAGDRVAAHEARVVGVRLTQVLLGRAHVRDERVVARRRRAPPRTSSGSAPTGAQAKHSCGALDRVLDRASRRGRSRPARRASSSRSGSRPKPTTSASATCSFAARPIEPPISPTPRTATLTPSENCLPASSAAASSLRR